MWQFSRFSHNTALITQDGEQISYTELESSGEQLSAVVDGRSLVCILCRNEKGSVLGYTAFLNHGIVPLMVNADIDHEMLEALLDNYMPDYLWLPDETIKEFSSYENIYSSWGYSLLRTGNTHRFPLNDELALLLTTSGSTGSPKFVRQSYKNIRSNCEAIVESLDLNESERPITTMPMNYTYGLSIINSHLWAGASILLTHNTLMQKEFWQLLKDHKATSFGGVPYIYEMLDKLRFFRMDLPTLKTMTQAGGRLSLELHTKFAEYAEHTGRRFFVMYGQTEATARMSYLPYERSLEKLGSIGVVTPGGKFSLIGTDGQEITEPESVGELIYHGDNVTLGYAESGADLIKGDDRKGVLATGDLAKRDTDGYYYIVGRKNRFLKIYGNRVNLDETEALVRTTFGCECACVGVDDKMSIYVTDEEPASKIRSYLCEKTGLNLSAFDVKVVSSIPKNEVGKTLYAALEAL
jgi:acyl-coenzyme A synthetase/AMP-(fatty) acid ligase